MSVPQHAFATTEDSMEPTALAQKTEKGQEEIRSRAHGLPQKLRTLLIMIDGKSSISQLLSRFPGVAEIEANLRQLIEQGFVTLGGSGVLSGGGAARSSSGGMVAETREAALSALTRMVVELAGPAADLVTGDLERARTRADVEAAAKRCAAMIEGMGGAKKAAAFTERASAYVARWINA
jgi:hypothetical protein